MNGIIDGESHDLAKGDLIITFGDGSATLNGNEFLSESAICEIGTYTLILSDIYGNTKTIHFTVIDTSYPVVTGISEGGVYTDKMEATVVSFNKGTT